MTYNKKWYEKNKAKKKAEKLARAAKGKSPQLKSAPVSDYGVSSELDAPIAVETEVEAHPDIGEVSFSERVNDKLRGLVSGEPRDVVSEEVPKKKYSYYSKKQEKERQEELSTLLTTLLVILVTAVPAPDGIKPNENELGALSVRTASICFRHNWLTGKLSGDALDAIGILAVLASYWNRVKPELHRLQSVHATSKGQGISEEAYEQTEYPQQPEARIDPFLDSLAERAERETEGEGLSASSEE